MQAFLQLFFSIRHLENEMNPKGRKVQSSYRGSLYKCIGPLLQRVFGSLRQASARYPAADIRIVEFFFWAATCHYQSEGMP